MIRNLLFAVRLSTKSLIRICEYCLEICEIAVNLAVNWIKKDLMVNPRDAFQFLNYAGLSSSLST
jgi:hypothetical protein